jgi:hypothetical protein
MSRKIKQQLVEIRKQVTREEIARMRSHVASRKKALEVLQQRRREFESQRRAERRSRLMHLQSKLRDAKRFPTSERRSRLQLIAAKRKAFAQWWAEVRAQRARMLQEIADLRAELKAFRTQWPERRKLAIASITAMVQRELDSFDDQTRAELEQLEKLIANARRELKVEQYDLKTWVRNRGLERKSTSKAPPRARAREAKVELESLVELNLVSPEEFAWWRRNKPSILREAKAANVTEPDMIAERVREATEADPDRALEFLQADADAWLEAELRKQGYAA